jgi:hypothetical protein
MFDSNHVQNDFIYQTGGSMSSTYLHTRRLFCRVRDKQHSAKRCSLSIYLPSDLRRVFFALIVGHLARDPWPGPWPVKTARYLGRPSPHFAGYGRPGPVAGRAMCRPLSPWPGGGPVGPVVARRFGLLSFF